VGKGQVWGSVLLGQVWGRVKCGEACSWVKCGEAVPQGLINTFITITSNSVCCLDNTSASCLVLARNYVRPLHLYDSLYWSGKNTLTHLFKKINLG
jgi:hypothetical protein